MDEKIKAQEIRLENLNSKILSAQTQLEEKLELLKTTQLEIDWLKMKNTPDPKSDIEIMKDKSYEYLYMAYHRQKMAVINDRIELPGKNISIF